jgi:hypothetical protein
MAEDPRGEEPNPFVTECIEEALAPLRGLPPGVLPPEVLADMEDSLETLLTTHPEVVAALDELRPRIAEASTGPRAQGGAVETPGARIPLKPTGTERR